MTSLKQVLVALTLGVAFIAGPSMADAKIVSHKPAVKHVLKKHATKVHRKHITKSSKKHKHLAGAGLAKPSKLGTHGKKPVSMSKKPMATRKVSGTKTAAGWKHHSQTL